MDQALSVILNTAAYEDRKQTRPTSNPAEVLSALGMDWEIVCLWGVFSSPGETGMTPVNSYSLFYTQLAMSQSFWQTFRDGT